jgi:hypothetical protein
LANYVYNNIQYFILPVQVTNKNLQLPPSLIGAGLLGAGAFAYAGWNALSDKPATTTKDGNDGVSVTEGVEEVKEDSGKVADQDFNVYEEAKTSTPPSTAMMNDETNEPKMGTGLENDHTFAEEEEETGNLSHHDMQGPAAENKDDEEQQQLHAPIIVDSKDVLGVIEEVFQQPTDEALEVGGSLRERDTDNGPENYYYTESQSETITRASTALTGLSAELLEVLGLSAIDVTPAGLLSKSALSDWESFPARHTQAVADSETLTRILKRIGHHVEAQLEKGREEVVEARGEVEAARAAIVEQSERFRSVLAESLAQAEKRHESKLQLQAEALKMSHSETLLRERAQRQEVLDGLRIKLNALQAALTQRTGIANESSKAHSLAQGAFALRTALREGSFVRAEEAVQNIAKVSDDPLVVVATKTFDPLLASTHSLPTRLQLIQELRQDVKRVARELVVFPNSHGKIPGFLSVTVAKAAAFLKVDERCDVNAERVGLGIDSALSKVEADMVAGRLVSAARNLEEATYGTAAAWAVKDWVAKVKARAAAEQLAAIVEASAIASTLEWIA